MMKRLGLCTFAAATIAAGAFAAVESGIKPGAVPGAFQVVDVSGPNKGRQLCYRCQYGIAPVAATFVNGDAAHAAQLVAELQKIEDEHKSKGLKSFVIFMSGPEAKGAIEKLAVDEKITIPLVFLPRGTKEKDVAAYKISPAAKNTLLLWRGSTVKSSFVDVDASKLPQVEKAVTAMLK